MTVANYSRSNEVESLKSEKLKPVQLVPSPIFVMDDEPVLTAVAPVLSIPTIQDLTEDNILPEDICEDFDQMIQNKPIENQILVFLPNEMVNYDALRDMVLHIYDLKESIR